MAGGSRQSPGELGADVQCRAGATCGRRQRRGTWGRVLRGAGSCVGQRLPAWVAPGTRCCLAVMGPVWHCRGDCGAAPPGHPPPPAPALALPCAATSSIPLLASCPQLLPLPHLQPPPQPQHPPPLPPPCTRLIAPRCKAVAPLTPLTPWGTPVLSPMPPPPLMLSLLFLSLPAEFEAAGCGSHPVPGGRGRGCACREKRDGDAPGRYAHPPRHATRGHEGPPRVQLQPVR